MKCGSARPRQTLAALGFAALLAITGCESGRGEPTAPDTSGSAVAPSSAPPPGKLYQVPAAADLCAAVRAAGVPTRELELRTPGPERQDCKVEVGANDKQRFTLRLKFEDKTSAERARLWIDDLREDYWSTGFSAFTGAPKSTGELRQIGALTVGAGFDKGFYAYYAPVEVANIKYGQSVMLLQRGNIVMTFDLLGGDAIGKGIAGIQPVKEDVGKELFDTIADETVALVKPRSG